MTYEWPKAHEKMYISSQYGNANQKQCDMQLIPIKVAIIKRHKKGTTVDKAVKNLDSSCTILYLFIYDCTESSLWPMGLVALQYVQSSQTRDHTLVP